MLTEGKYLENTFCREYTDEAEVQVVQGKVPHVGLSVVVQRHGEHVETDEHHDDHVKLLVSNNTEYNGLRSPLDKKKVIDSYSNYQPIAKKRRAQIFIVPPLAKSYISPLSLYLNISHIRINICCP